MTTVWGSLNTGPVGSFSALVGVPWSKHLYVAKGLRPMWLWVKTNGIPFWGFRCTAHFRTYFGGDWDIHWGYGLLTHGHVLKQLFWWSTPCQGAFVQLVVGLYHAFNGARLMVLWMDEIFSSHQKMKPSLKQIVVGICSGIIKKPWFLN